MTPEGIAALLHAWGYPTYFALFVASAFGSPLTEDLLLLVGGYLIGAGIFTWPATLVIALAGVLATDTVLFAFGRKLRQHTLRRGFVRRFIRPGRLRVATRWFARFGDRVVFVSRLVPGTRLLVFVSAGVKGMPLAKFLAYDFAAALIWVPLLLASGAFLGERVGGLHQVLEWIGHRVIWLAGALAGLFVARQIWLGVQQQRAGNDVDPT
jgi:membrane protein DedA with SNARE-associated domain